MRSAVLFYYHRGMSITRMTVPFEYDAPLKVGPPQYVTELIIGKVMLKEYAKYVPLMPPHRGRAE